MASLAMEKREVSLKRDVSFALKREDSLLNKGASLPREKREVWEATREGRGVDFGVSGRRRRRSHWRSPSLMVKSREVFAGRGGMKEVGLGMWWGNWRVEEGMRREERAAEIWANRVVRFSQVSMMIVSVTWEERDEGDRGFGEYMESIVFC